jgi:hypothetical protein
VLHAGQTFRQPPVFQAAHFFAMRWLMIGLLVSLSALLLAAAGVARHVWLQRSRPPVKPVLTASQPQDPADEVDL